MPYKPARQEMVEQTAFTATHRILDGNISDDRTSVRDDPISSFPQYSLGTNALMEGLLASCAASRTARKLLHQAGPHPHPHPCVAASLGMARCIPINGA